MIPKSGHGSIIPATINLDCTVQKRHQSLEMKSKPGENVKIAALTPSPSIFTDAFLPTASYDRRDQEMFHLNEWEDHLYPHVLKVVLENCLTPLRSIASVLMPFSRHYRWNLIKKCYLYG